MFGRDAINYHLMKKQGLIEPYAKPAEALNALGVIDAMILPAALYSSLHPVERIQARPPSRGRSSPAGAWRGCPG